MNCSKCKSERNWRNGFEKGLQRCLCRDCGLNFTENTDLNKIHKDTKPPEVKKLALYLKGSSARYIKEIIYDTFEISVIVTTILKWIEKKGLKFKKIKKLKPKLNKQNS